MDQFTGLFRDWLMYVFRIVSLQLHVVCPGFKFVKLA